MAACTGHLGEFYGAHRGGPWNLAIQGCVTAKWLKLDEEGLANKSWFDYWGIRPTTLTYYFAHCLAKVHSKYFARCRDHAAAPFVKPWKGNDPLLRSNRATTALWRARQAADSIGARYPVFIDSCYKLSTSRSWTHMPQPNQMYSGLMMERAVEAWEAEKRVSMQWAANPGFRLYRSEGFTWEQRQYIKWVFSQIRLRSSKDHLVATALAKRHLTPELINGVLGRDQLDRSLRILADNESK